MNRNLIIWLLVAVIVIGGAYWLVKSNQNTVSTYEPPSTTQNTTTSSNTSTPPPAVPPLTVGTPMVETSSNVTTSNSSALVTGQVTPNGTPTSYWFEYGTTNALGSKTISQQIGSGFYPTSSPAFITGLIANTTYYFRLAADNNFGIVYGTSYSFTTNSTPPPIISLPTVHTNNATSVSRVDATIEGQVDPNGWQTNYWFEYGTDKNFGSTTSFTSVDTNTSIENVSETISSLEPLTKYYFRLNAQNQFGTVNGSTLSFTTSGPLNPGAPVVTTSQATSVQSVSAQINGRINPNGVDTTYWFEYSQDSLLGTLIGGETPTQTLSAGTSTTNVNTNIDGLSADTKYYYHLVAENQYGTVYGSILSFTTRS